MKVAKRAEVISIVTLVHETEKDTKGQPVTLRCHPIDAKEHLSHGGWRVVSAPPRVILDREAPAQTAQAAPAGPGSIAGITDGQEDDDDKDPKTGAGAKEDDGKAGDGKADAGKGGAGTKASTGTKTAAK